MFYRFSIHHHTTQQSKSFNSKMSLSASRFIAKSSKYSFPNEDTDLMVKELTIRQLSNYINFYVELAKKCFHTDKKVVDEIIKLTDDFVNISGFFKNLDIKYGAGFTDALDFKLEDDHPFKGGKRGLTLVNTFSNGAQLPLLMESVFYRLCDVITFYDNCNQNRKQSGRRLINEQAIEDINRLVDEYVTGGPKADFPEQIANLVPFGVYTKKFFPVFSKDQDKYIAMLSTMNIREKVVKQKTVVRIPLSTKPSDAPQPCLFSYSSILTGQPEKKPCAEIAPVLVQETEFPTLGTKQFYSSSSSSSSSSPTSSSSSSSSSWETPLVPVPEPIAPKKTTIAFFKDSMEFRGNKVFYKDNNCNQIRVAMGLLQGPTTFKKTKIDNAGLWMCVYLVFDSFVKYEINASRKKDFGNPAFVSLKNNVFGFIKYVIDEIESLDSYAKNSDVYCKYLSKHIARNMDLYCKEFTIPTKNAEAYVPLTKSFAKIYIEGTLVESKFGRPERIFTLVECLQFLISRIQDIKEYHGTTLGNFCEFCSSPDSQEFMGQIQQSISQLTKRPAH